MFSSFSLRQWLTIPYLVLVLGVATVIGTLSYRTGSEVVDTLSHNLLLEIVNRIELTIERHLVGSSAVLEAAFPEGLSAALRIEGELPALRQRLWAATSLHTDPNNYVYYGNEAGQNVGVFRQDRDHAELRVRLKANSPRLNYALTAIDAPLPEPTLTHTQLDSRQRPWYRGAKTGQMAIWTSVYIDFNTHNLVVTRAKRVPSRQGNLQGVVATDVDLAKLNRFVRALEVSPNGIAFVIEPNGELIASSRTPNVATVEFNNTNARMNAADSGDALQQLAYASVREDLSRPADAKPTQAMSKRISGPDGADVQLAYHRLRDDAGLDWLIVVAVPRSDFMQGVTANVLRTAAIGVGAAMAAVALGLLILEWLSADLLTLTKAAQRIGESGWDELVEAPGGGGIATLTTAFREMQMRLRTDTLTGLNNREIFLRNVNSRIKRARRRKDLQPFVLLFIDLDKFKMINDTLGHSVGDEVLIEVGRRLRTATRSEDVVARYAGDEFVVLLDNITNPELAEQLRQSVETELRKPWTSPDLSALSVTFEGGSVGVATYPGTAESASELVRLADKDMYRRKMRKV
jgi:diguanylate cyclase (GGDEF)-like protein